MTRRAFILGLLSAAAVSGLCFFNDWVLRQTYLVGNNMPASIYGILILVALVLNPLLPRRFSLSGRELAVILALTLAGASIPGGGLVRTLIPTLVMPYHIEKTSPGWREEDVLKSIPRHMLVDISKDEDRIVNGYVQGLGEGDRHVSLADIPWRAWLLPLAFWLPLALVLWIGLIGLSLVVHRQWSRHEHLPYPIATFTEALLPRDGERVPKLFYQRAFWVTTGIVLAIHLNNFACVWFPDMLIRIPTRFDLRPLAHLLPVLARGGGSGLLYPHIYLIIIGIAYFIPGDVALSFGIGPFLWYILLGILAGYGINLRSPVEGTSYFSLNPQSFALFGANVGIISAVLFTGRRYYAGVARQAVGIGSRDAIDGTAVWGFRVFTFTCLAMLFAFCAVGIDPVLAIAYITFMLIGFIVLSRIIAETGLIYLKCYFWPGVILWGVFGARALTTQQMLLLFLMSTVLFIDPREALPPFMANSLKVLEFRRVRLGRAAWSCVAAIVIAILVSVPVTLYIKYDMGSSTGDSWSTITVPRVACDNVVLIRRKMHIQGMDSPEPTGSFLSRLHLISPSGLCLTMMAVGFALVLTFTAARLRFSWWPLHPLMFVTWASTPLRWMGVSYLIAWVIKILVTKYGGSKLYGTLKPVMMGLIAGEVLGALFPSLFGLVYYLITNHQPKMFNVIPG